MAYYTLDMCDSFMALSHHAWIYCSYENKLEDHCGEEEVAIAVRSSVHHIIKYFTVSDLPSHTVEKAIRQFSPTHVCNGPGLAC